MFLTAVLKAVLKAGGDPHVWPSLRPHRDLLRQRVARCSAEPFTNRVTVSRPGGRQSADVSVLPCRSGASFEANHSVNTPAAPSTNPLNLRFGAPHHAVPSRCRRRKEASRLPPSRLGPHFRASPAPHRPGVRTRASSVHQVRLRRVPPSLPEGPERRSRWPESPVGGTRA